MELSGRDRDELQRLEEYLWRAETRYEDRYMREVMAPDFLEFGRSGRVSRREDSLTVPRRPIDAVLPLPDFSARLLHPDVAQVTYNSAVTYDGVVQRARRSSIWSRTPGGWVRRVTLCASVEECRLHTATLPHVGLLSLAAQSGNGRRERMNTVMWVRLEAH
jgi:hypothetical protein